MSKTGSYSQLRIDSIEAWRVWLEEHYLSEKGVWLVFKKKGSGRIPFDYQMALDEALCHGWIDSLVKAIDEKEYMRKFTPRKTTSQWSSINKKKVASLIREGRMRAAGKKAIEVAKKNGMWDKEIKAPEVDDSLPGVLLNAFQSHPEARDNYFKMPVSHQRRFNIWINMARRAETIRKRVEETILLLEKGEGLGLK